MTVLLAAAAGAVAVLALWDGVRAAEAAAVRGGLAILLAPWRLAGERGRVASGDERRRLAVVGGVTLAAGATLVAGPTAGVLVGVSAPVAAGRLLAWRRERWAERVAQGAPAVARALADALGGGHSVRGALAEAALAGGTGAASDAELRAVAAELAVGEPTAEVLGRFAERVAVPVHDVLVAAILLQQDTGGDLAATLRGLAADLEDMRRSTQDARTATVQARFSARVVMGLPVVVAVLAELVSPGTVVALVSSPIPAVLVALALLLDTVALVAVRRIARVAT